MSLSSQSCGSGIHLAPIFCSRGGLATAGVPLWFASTRCWCCTAVSRQHLCLVIFINQLWSMSTVQPRSHSWWDGSRISLQTKGTLCHYDYVGELLKSKLPPLLRACPKEGGLPPTLHRRCFGPRVDFDSFASALPTLLHRAQECAGWLPTLHLSLKFLTEEDSSCCICWSLLHQFVCLRCLSRMYPSCQRHWPKLEIKWNQPIWESRVISVYFDSGMSTREPTQCSFHFIPGCFLMLADASWCFLMLSVQDLTSKMRLAKRRNAASVWDILRPLENHRVQPYSTGNPSSNTSFGTVWWCLLSKCN